MVVELVELVVVGGQAGWWVVCSSGMGVCGLWWIEGVGVLRVSVCPCLSPWVSMCLCVTLCVFALLCVSFCVCLCVHVCLCVSLCVSVWLCMSLCVSLCVAACVCVCLCVLCVCQHVSMSVCKGVKV